MIQQNTGIKNKPITQYNFTHIIFQLPNKLKTAMIFWNMF